MCQNGRDLIYTNKTDTKSEVKKSEILSPIFYKIFIGLYKDDLMKEKIAKKLGCTNNDMYLGTIFLCR